MSSPIFAEIVPERCRTAIYALDQSFESDTIFIRSPLSWVLAQHVFDYKPVQKGSTDSEEIETDRENAAPLSKALYSAIGIPYVICCLIYSLLYCTYPRDRERARMNALVESEMQRKETGVIAREFEGEERLDFDENDENVAKRLLSHVLNNE